MQDEVNEKVVSLAIKTSKLTAEVLQKAMKALLAKGKGQLTKAPHGKITMRQLMKPGEKVSNIEITDQNIKAFDPIARKNGLDYNVKKIENGKPPTYLVSFKGKPETDDADSDTEKTLPPFTEGQTFDNPAATVTEHDTIPPKPHNEDMAEISKLLIIKQGEHMLQ